MMNIETVLIPQYDGREIMERHNFKSAIRLKEERETITWLVETLLEDKLIIEATTTEWPGQKPHTAYKVFHGLAVEKYARQHTLLQSNAHHLLTQLV